MPASRALDVGPELLVLEHGAALVIPPAAADDGKVDAVLRHLGPVDGPLVGGHVDARQRAVLLGIGHHAVGADKGGVVIVVHGHPVQLLQHVGAEVDVIVKGHHLPHDDAQFRPVMESLGLKYRLLPDFSPTTTPF